MTKILLVEDDLDVRQNLQDLLEAEQFQVYVAENGLLALDVLENITPDLIICDVMMPGLDGPGLLKWITDDPNLASIPFIFLTAKADPADVREAMNIGADDYLTKPFTREQLLKTINSRLAKSNKVEKKYESQFDELRSNIAVSLPHELRTPLTGIMGFSEYLIENIESTTKEELKEYLTYIYNSGKRLNRLVENYIAFSELQIKRHNRNLKMGQLANKPLSVKEYLIQISQTVSYEHEREEDLEVKAEDIEINVAEKDFEKICVELIDNAFRFSKRGQKVHISCVPDGDFVEVSIRDHGHGMSNSQVGKLGGFVQIDRDKNEQQGSGLGFTIARHLIELLDGTMKIDSKVNFGTTVSFKIPISG